MSSPAPIEIEAAGRLSENTRTVNSRERWAVGAGTIGAVLASTCCVVPFALFSAGISGAWMSRLTALAPYQPYAIALSVVALLFGFYWVYRKPTAESCSADGYCAKPVSRTILKTGLWASTLLIGLNLIWPWLMSFLY